MAQVIWTEPALSDLSRIADCISLDNPTAAERLVQRVFDHVEMLEKHPQSGSIPQEAVDRAYRQIVESPCRVFYTCKQDTVFVVSVFRSEQKITKRKLELRSKLIKKD